MKAKTTSKERESVTVTEHISRVVASLQDQGCDVIDNDYVANVVESRIDVHQISPHLMKYLALLELKQQIRSYLRHALDPMQVVTDKVKSGQDDLFDDLLQDYYPADREILGVKKSVYVKRESLTGQEVELNAAKMEMASEALAKHAEALRAWYFSK